ncbi:MAG: A/G-specific adenine glycosylase, partial [Tannerellaceae bacterium]|nr:A/G-specific adenine glycosylase [Tannerellaceae bacterium]
MDETGNKKDLIISHILIDWYEMNKRDLPWRQSSDPYIIWISEIILQQTRVAQGMDYFYRFTGRFPDVASLAGASEDEVLKYWQGLGYCSRARNLHAAAKTIMEKFGGHFPDTYKEILSLKGIGEYTAAAIASFVWNQPYPVVDGNVFRVLARLFALPTPIDTGAGKKEFTELASLVMDPAVAGLHNQAIMEFGALQCTPQNPACMFCPLQQRCMAFLSHTVQQYPVKQNKIKTRNRYFHYLYIINGDTTYLNRRGKGDIWEGLYEFPLIETGQPCDLSALQQTENFRRLFEGCGKVELTVDTSNTKHVLSHQVLYASFYRVTIEKAGPGLEAYLPVKRADLDKFAVSRLIH